MRIFKEEQRFNQWWIIVTCTISGIGILLSLGPFQGFSENLSISKLLGAALGLFICIGIFFVKMHTKIDKSGIQVWFSPFKFTKKSFSWKELENVYTRKYNALTEYGGWGIRGLTKAKAYNVKGDKGIQLKTKEGKFFLIGTQQKQNVDRIIDKYFKNSEE